MNVSHLKPVAYEIIHAYNDHTYTLRQLCVAGVYKWFILFKSSYKTVLTKDGLVYISQAIANKEYFGYIE